MNQSIEISVKVSTEVRIHVESDVICDELEAIPLERENEVELFPEETEETLTWQLLNALEDLKVDDFFEGKGDL